MKRTFLWMVTLAMAVSPLLAQEGEPSQPEEQPQTEEQIENQAEEAVQEPAQEPVQEPDVPTQEPTEEIPEGPTEEDEIEAAIEEAMGGESVVVEEEVGFMEEEEVGFMEEESAIQEEERNDRPQHREVQTLMTGSGGYGAISFGFTEVNGLPALQMGAQGEWVLGHSFGLGIGGVGFTSDFTQEGDYYYAVSGGYGGLIMEPIIAGWFPIHVSFPVLVGGGGLASYATNSDPWDYDNVEPTFGESAGFFIVEVGAELEFNLVRFFRLSLFGAYRWTSELNMKPWYGLDPDENPYPVSSYALNGWSAGVRFKFGSF